MALTAYLDNPPADQNTDALFVYVSTINVRGRFNNEWSGRGFTGYALGMSPICISVSAIAAAMSEGKKNALLTAARLMKAEYNIQSSYGAIGISSAKQTELMVAAAKNGPPYARDHIFLL